MKKKCFERLLKLTNFQVQYSTVCTVQFKRPSDKIPYSSLSLCDETVAPFFVFPGGVKSVVSRHRLPGIWGNRIDQSVLLQFRPPPLSTLARAASNEAWKSCRRGDTPPKNTVRQAPRETREGEGGSSSFEPFFQTGNYFVSSKFNLKLLPSPHKKSSSSFFPYPSLLLPSHFLVRCHFSSALRFLLLSFGLCKKKFQAQGFSWRR